MITNIHNRVASEMFPGAVPQWRKRREVCSGLRQVFIYFQRPKVRIRERWVDPSAYSSVPGEYAWRRIAAGSDVRFVPSYTEERHHPRRVVVRSGSVVAPVLDELHRGALWAAAWLRLFRGSCKEGPYGRADA